MISPHTVMPVVPATRAGLWRDSRLVFVLGSPLVVLLVSLVAVSLVWPTLHGWAGLLLALMLIGAGVLLILVPLASWIAWPVAPPDIAAPLRWLMLTLVASTITGLALGLLTASFKAIEAWPWIAVPAAGIHALWTAIFLVGRRR